MYNSGTIIALAWPDTKVVREGKWYDVPMKWVGAIKEDHYIAGHAALLLVNNYNGELHYFDYGRYQTPIKQGRVRDEHTDPDIAAKLIAVIENRNIANLEEILLERYYNKACHGDGRLTASIVKNIHFDKAYSKAKAIQGRGAIPYGPFELNGSTCSRFVAQVVLASTNNWLTQLLIKLPYTISATPRSNNKVLNDYSLFYEINDGTISRKKSNFYAFKNLVLPKKHISESEGIESVTTELISDPL